MMTLREYLRNPIALNPQVSLYTVDGVGVRRLHQFLPNETVDDCCNLSSSPRRNEQVRQISCNSNFAVISKTDSKPPREDEIPNAIRILYHCNLGEFRAGRVKHLPMGRDFRSSAAFQHFFESQKGRLLKKEKLIYANFSLNTHKSRRAVMRQLQSLPFVDCVSDARYRNYPISRENYANTLAQYCFVACPRGRGKDTFRFWDSLCCGCVPIVTAKTQPQWDLPFIEVEQGRWSELDEDYLKRQWAQMLDREYRFESLLQDYWIDKITLDYRTHSQF